MGRAPLHLWLTSPATAGLDICSKYIWVFMVHLMDTNTDTRGYLTTDGRPMSDIEIAAAVGVHTNRYLASMRHIQRCADYQAREADGAITSALLQKWYVRAAARAAAGAAGGNPRLVNHLNVVTRADVEPDPGGVSWDPSVKITRSGTHEDYLYCVRWWLGRAYRDNNGEYFRELERDYPATKPSAVASELYLWLKAHPHLRRTALHQTLCNTWLRRNQRQAEYRDQRQRRQTDTEALAL